MAMTSDNRTRVDWHLDRRVSLSIIVLLIANIAAGVWWAATTDARLERLEEMTTATAERSKDNADRIVDMRIRAAEQDQKLQSILDLLQRIDSRLAQMERRTTPTP